MTLFGSLPAGFGSSNIGYLLCWMVADGFKIRLTHYDRFDGYLVWSPDGSRVAFVSSRPDEPLYDNYVLEANGANIMQMTDGIEDFSQPAWSPDCIHIAYQSGDFHNSVIYTVNVVNGEIVPLIYKFGHISDFSWSPDGTRIAFVTKFNRFYLWI